MIKWFAGLGCLVVVVGIAVVGAMLHTMGLLKYVVTYGQLLLGLTSSPDARAANWVAAEAQVVNIELRTDEHYRDLARLLLRYVDASGREQMGIFEVYSPSRGLGRIRGEARLKVQVCRHDPSIVKSDQFVLAERRRCAPGR